MTAKFSNTTFYNELKSALPASTGTQRQKWAGIIVKKNIPLEDLSKLLKGDPKTATRFLWLLSDVGIANRDTLFRALPFLLKACEKLDPVYKMAFASLWNIAGVPPKNEAKAIDLLFRWVLSADTNVTIKSRSFWVLAELTKKYPELKNELKLCLEDQADKYSCDFKKRATKLLLQLEQ